MNKKEKKRENKLKRERNRTTHAITRVVCPQVRYSAALSLNVVCHYVVSLWHRLDVTAVSTGRARTTEKYNPVRRYN